MGDEQNKWCVVHSKALEKDHSSQDSVFIYHQGKRVSVNFGSSTKDMAQWLLKP